LKVIKYFLLIVIFLFSEAAYSQGNLPCKKFHETKTSVGTVIEKMTGVNFLKIRAAEIYTERYIKKQSNNKVKISIKAKSAKALFNGEFTQIKASADKITYGNFSITDFKAQTMATNNIVIYDKNSEKCYFPKDLPIAFSTVITNEDLTKITNDYNYKKNSSFKVPLFGMNIFKVEAENWKIENSKLKIIFGAHSPFLNTKIKLTTALNVKDGEFVFSNSDEYNDKLNRLLTSLNFYNPFKYMVKLAENTTGCIEIKDVKVVKDKIYLKGIFLIPKNCDITK